MSWATPQYDSAYGLGPAQVAASSSNGQPLTFAQLPASSVKGTTYMVTDASAVVAKGVTVAGSGSAQALVTWNGTNWVGA